MIRIEISRQTVVTFKTLKAAENRVARDAEWLANAAEPGTLGTVEVSPRWDAAAARTLFDVQYVVCDVLEAAPEGAEVRVTGPYSGSAAYGYVGTVEPRDAHGRVHVANGRSRWILQANDDVLVTALPLDDDEVTDLHLADGSCCGEGGDRDVDGCDAVTAEDIAEGEYLSTSAPASTPRSSDPVDSLIEHGDTVSWWVRVDGQGGDSTTEVGSLEEALDVWREVLETQPLAEIQVLTAVNGEHLRVYADVAEHDTCTVHRDAVFSKNGPCPVCLEEEEAAWAKATAEQEANWLTSDADSLQESTVETLRALLARDADTTAVARPGGFLTPAERAALVHATYVLEG